MADHPTDVWDSAVTSDAGTRFILDPHLQGLLPRADLRRWAHTSPPDRRWILKDLVPASQMTLLTGAGATGKSLLLQQLCTCVASGRPFLGIGVERRPCLYLTCEDDLDELWRRQEAICRQLRVDLESLHDCLDIVSLAGEHDCALALYEAQTAGDDLRSGREASMRPTRRYRALLDAAQCRQYGLVGLDNTAQLFAGNENARHEVASFAALLTRLAIVSNGAVVLAGHPNKAGEEYSGSTAWNNQVRSRLFLSRSDEFDPDARRLVGSKANYAAANGEIRLRWHEWAFVAEKELGEDAHAAIRQTAMASADNDLFLQCLRAFRDQGRTVSASPSANYAPARFEEMPMAKAAGAGKKRLSQAMERLFAIGAIEIGFIKRDRKKARDVYGIKEVE